MPTGVKGDENVTKRIDPDIKVLQACIRALDSSSSSKMLRANLEFLVERYGYPGGWAKSRKWSGITKAEDDLAQAMNDLRP